jgi:hypothetical protein
VTAVRWTRTDQSDGAHEILTIVRIEGQPDLCVEVCAGPEIGDDFVGLYDLDGDQLTTGNCSWEAVDACEVPADVVSTIETDWEHGTTVVERLGVQS